LRLLLFVIKYESNAFAKDSCAKWVSCFNWCNSCFWWFISL